MHNNKCFSWLNSPEPEARNGMTEVREADPGKNGMNLCHFCRSPKADQVEMMITCEYIPGLSKDLIMHPKIFLQQNGGRKERRVFFSKHCMKYALNNSEWDDFPRQTNIFITEEDPRR